MMGKWEKREGIMLPRDRRRLDQHPERRSRAKKDRKRWCKGKKGREHVPTIEFNPMWMSLGRSCDRTRRWYACYHQEVCKNCGKVLRWSIDASECPDLKREVSRGRKSDGT